MRFMILVRAPAEFDAEAITMPSSPVWVVAMAAYHEELAKAGVLLDTGKLQPGRNGWCLRFGADGSQLLEGRFAEASHLIAGYTLIQVRSREEAMEWSRRFPNPVGLGRDALIEVRQLVETDVHSPADNALPSRP